MIQFSIFSESSGTTEIEDAYTHLTDLYDEVTFSITDALVMIMARQNANLISIEADVEGGTGEYFQYDVDYRVLITRD
jgi:hypothetical protein